MNIRSLLVTFVVVIIVECTCINTSFSLSLMDKFNEPSLEELLGKKPNGYLKIPEHMRIILIVNNLVPWEISNFVHLCKVSHGGIQCSQNGFTQFISATFVDMNDVTNVEKRAEIRFHPHTGNAAKLILKIGNIPRVIGINEVKI
jgi:hypothetical protein